MGWLSFLGFGRKESETVTPPVVVTAGAVTAVIPAGRVLAQFRCVKDFWSPEFKSQYVADGVYSLREGNDRLAKALPAWVKAGKVEYS